jgi:3-deoxy-manno-octulosonate cytidylyltransferase (CMP-KDO synthetase)
MIWWVWSVAKQVSELESVYVATDDERIANVVYAFGGEVVMTGECSCGTERVAQAVANLDCDIVLNIQGDEPVINPEMLRDLMSAFGDTTVGMATLKKEIVEPSDLNNPNVAKITTDIQGNALYFSRSLIPFNRDNCNDVRYFKHIGLYGYTKEFLNIYANLPQGRFEQIEQLEQLRTLEHGYKLRVVETKYDVHAVDVPEDIPKVSNLLALPSN